MGVEAPAKARRFLPFIGEVQLRLGFPTTKETLDRFFKKRVIIGNLGKLYDIAQDFEA